MSSTTFSRADTSNHFCSILDGLLRVESSLFAGESLTDDFCVFREAEILTCSFIASEADSELSQLQTVWKCEKRVSEKYLFINQSREQKSFVVTIWRSPRVRVELSHMMHSD